MTDVKLIQLNVKWALPPKVAVGTVDINLVASPLL